MRPVSSRVRSYVLALLLALVPFNAVHSRAIRRLSSRTLPVTIAAVLPAYTAETVDLLMAIQRLPPSHRRDGLLQVHAEVQQWVGLLRDLMSAQPSGSNRFKAHLLLAALKTTLPAIRRSCQTAHMVPRR
jgi:hypothetical protein